MKDITIISTFAKDVFIRKGIKYEKKGGPAKFIKDIFDNNNISYNLITPLKETIVEIKILESDEISRVIKKQEIKSVKINKDSNIIISTILDEFNLKNLPEVDGIIALDIQGFVRSPKGFGAKRKFTKFEKYYDKIKILKGTKKELEYVNLDILQKIPIVIITNGNKEGHIMKKGKIIEKIKSEKINTKDTVGAGDTFLSAFLVEYLKSNNVKKSKDFAKKYVINFLRDKNK